MTTVLLTGASGFAGAHMLRHLLMNTDYQIICPVTFRHRGNPDRIASSIQNRDEWHQRVSVVMCDLSAPVPAHLIDAWGDVSIIYNIASQSHVDRAIECPGPFVRNNVELMIHVLSLAKKLPNLRLFLHMSTDEVFGPAIVPTLHTEWEPSRPSNPYSASKAAQEALAFSWWRTYGVPIVVTNTMNLFGEMQDREKYFAKVMRAVANKDVITVHSSPDGTIGSRYYIHARNFADAWLHLSNIPDIVQRYPAWDELNRFNIVGDKEVNNLDLALMIANAMGKPLYYELTNFHATRPGHDLRYALDGSKMAGTGWVAPVSFEESVHRTVEWTLKNPVWG